MHAVSRSESRIMRPRIHAAARRRDRRHILLGACCNPVRRVNAVDRGSHRTAVNPRRPWIHCRTVGASVCQGAGNAPMKTAPNVPNKGARRGAKCASAAHEGGAPLGFQPVHTPGQTRRSSRGVGDIPDTASSPRRHRYRGAHASPPLSQPPARYRPLDLNFSTLQCSTVLLYDLGILYTVQLYTVLDQATV